MGDTGGREAYRFVLPVAEERVERALPGLLVRPGVASGGELLGVVPEEIDARVL